MNIDRLKLGEINNLSSNMSPIMGIQNKEIEKELKQFLGVRRNVLSIFGKILAEIGFKSDDVIFFKNIVYERNGYKVIFDYLVNLEENSENKIVLNFGDLQILYSLVVSNKDMVVECGCSVYKNDIRLKVNKIEERLDNGRKYLRTYGWSDSDYIVDIGNRKIRLHLNRLNDNDYQRLMVIEKESKLEEYLKNVDEDITIDSLYKDIAVYFGDISKYGFITLSMGRVLNEEKRIEVTDFICIKDGECLEFGITRDNKKIILKHNNSWEYNYNDETYSINSKGNDGQVTYNISAKDKDSLKECATWSDVEFELLTEEVENTKKLVREMFSKRR